MQVWLSSPGLERIGTQVDTHSLTLPTMSYKPKRLGANDATGAVFLPSQRLPQPLQLPRFFPSLVPQAKRAWEPAAAAYSHSSEVAGDSAARFSG